VRSICLGVVRDTMVWAISKDLLHSGNFGVVYGLSDVMIFLVYLCQLGIDECRYWWVVGVEENEWCSEIGSLCDALLYCGVAWRLFCFLPSRGFIVYFLHREPYRMYGGCVDSGPNDFKGCISFILLVGLGRRGLCI